MHRAIPASSKLLTHKWLQQDRDTHLGKLKEMRSSVDSWLATKLGHLNAKSKREQIIEGKWQLMIVEKISSIKQTLTLNDYLIIIDKIFPFY